MNHQTQDSRRTRSVGNKDVIPRHGSPCTLAPAQTLTLSRGQFATTCYYYREKTCVQKGTGLKSMPFFQESKQCGTLPHISRVKPESSEVGLVLALSSDGSVPCLNDLCDTLRGRLDLPRCWENHIRGSGGPRTHPARWEPGRDSLGPPVPTTWATGQLQAGTGAAPGRVFSPWGQTATASGLQLWESVASSN